MSSADAGKARMSRRSLVRGLSLLLAAAPALSACSDGFKPLYGVGSAGAGAGPQKRLARVDFAPIPGRVGQRIRNELVFQSTGGGGGSGEAPKQRLEIALKESLVSTLVRVDGDAAGSIYAIEASFRLIDINNKQIVFQGTAIARAGFERFSSVYSNVRAREDAENRAAQTVAEDIKTRLVTYLSREA
jgi:LPS-assembly lipoprotein